AVDYLVKPVAPEILRSKAAKFAELYKNNAIHRAKKRILRIRHDEMERRVKERTADLARVNEELGLANEELNVVLEELESQKETIRNVIANVPGVVWEATGIPN